MEGVSAQPSVSNMCWDVLCYVMQLFPEPESDDDEEEEDEGMGAEDEGEEEEEEEGSVAGS